MLERDWKGLILLLKNERLVKHHLSKRPDDFLGAIKCFDKRIRVLWVNAFQAKEWNDNIDVSKKTQSLKHYPLIPEMPELGVFPGAKRRTVMEVKDFKVRGKVIEFTLPKGSYATVLINFLLSEAKSEQ